MKYSSRSGEAGAVNYEATAVVESKHLPGVRMTIRRMSFGRRIELIGRILTLSRRVEFLESGTDPREKLEASLLASEIDRVYLEWGLASVEGLEIDGAPATPESVIATGPEALCGEALAAIKAQFGLSAEERKN